MLANYWWRWKYLYEREFFSLQMCVRVSVCVYCVAQVSYILFCQQDNCKLWENQCISLTMFVVPEALVHPSSFLILSLFLSFLSLSLFTISPFCPLFSLCWAIAHRGASLFLSTVIASLQMSSIQNFIFQEIQPLPVSLFPFDITRLYNLWSFSSFFPMFKLWLLPCLC